MCLGAINGLLAVAVGLLASDLFSLSIPGASDLKVGAQYAFMHTMATFAAFTFRRAGAERACVAPVFFLGGAAAFSGPLYAIGLGAPSYLHVLIPLGAGCLLVGWCVLARAALDLVPHSA